MQREENLHNTHHIIEECRQEIIRLNKEVQGMFTLHSSHEFNRSALCAPHLTGMINLNLLQYNKT